MKVNGWLGVGTALCMLAAGPALAVWVETQVTPKDAASGRVTFRVAARDRAGLRDVSVTVAPGGGTKLPLGITARVSLRDEQDGEIAAVPVQAEREGGRLTYRFQLAPRLLAHARFEFGEHGYAVLKDDAGRVLRDETGAERGVLLPGGTGYWLNLRDFLPAEG